MVKLGRTKHEDSDRSAKYQSVGRALLQTARDLELKSTDGEHLQAADVFVHALGHHADADQVRRLRRILGTKSHASYSGSYYTLDDGREILQDLERFTEWAEERLTERRLA